MYRLLLLLLFLFTIQTVDWASDRPDALALLQRAANISNIRSSDVGPFRLRARVHVYGNDAAEAEYLLLWASPERWREEISNGDHRAIRIGSKNITAITGDTVQAQVIRLRVRHLDMGTILRIGSGESLGRVKNQGHAGVTMQCVSHTNWLKFKEELCFDALSGTLLTRRSNGRTEFSKYSEFHGKLVPRLITVSDEKRVYEMIEVQELAPFDAAANSSLFDIDARYKITPGCEHPVLATPIKTSDPEYPPQLRTPNPQIVKLWVVVNESGAIESFSVLRSAGALDVYAIKALRTWRFSPATCAGIAVPSQLFTEISFTAQ